MLADKDKTCAVVGHFNAEEAITDAEAIRTCITEGLLIFCMEAQVCQQNNSTIFQYWID